MGRKTVGKFFAFDGIDRAGKTSAIASVEKELRLLGAPVVSVKGGCIGDLRVADRYGVYPDEVVYMLFWQSHRLTDLTAVRPLLASAQVVLCDRYILSTLGHSWWTDLDSTFQRCMESEYIKRFTLPDIYFLFTIPYKTFLERDDGDTKMGPVLFYRMQEDYVMWAQRLKANFRCNVVLVDGSQKKDDVDTFVLGCIKQELGI